jgi:hypothetical protein
LVGQDNSAGNAALMQSFHNRYYQNRDQDHSPASTSNYIGANTSHLLPNSGYTPLYGQYPASNLQLSGSKSHLYTRGFSAGAYYDQTMDRRSAYQGGENHQHNNIFNDISVNYDVKKEKRRQRSSKAQKAVENKENAYIQISNDGDKKSRKNSHNALFKGVNTTTNNGYLLNMLGTEATMNLGGSDGYQSLAMLGNTQQ